MKLQIFHCKSDTYQKKYKNKCPQKNWKYTELQIPIQKNIKINYHGKWNPINNNSQRYNLTCNSSTTLKKSWYSCIILIKKHFLIKIWNRSKWEVIVFKLSFLKKKRWNGILICDMLLWNGYDNQSGLPSTNHHSKYFPNTHS